MDNTNSNQLKQVTNVHHVQSTKSNMYSSTGSKSIKNTTTLIKKTGAMSKIGGAQVLSQTQNFTSMSNTTLKTKTAKKFVGSSNMSLKQDIKSGGKDLYRSNISSSLTNNSKIVKVNGNTTSSIKINKKLTNKLSATKVPFDRKSESRHYVREVEESSPHSSS